MKIIASPRLYRQRDAVLVLSCFSAMTKQEGRNFTRQVLRYVPLLSLLLRLIELLLKRLGQLDYLRGL